MMDRQRVLHNPRLLEVLVHAVVWLLIFGFPLALMEYTSFVKWDAMGYLRHLRMPLAFGIVFYVNYMWLVSHLLFKSGWRRFLIYNLLLVVAVGVLLHFSSEWLHSGAPVPPFPRMHHDGRMITLRLLFYLRDMMMLGFTAALAVVIRMSREWRIAEQARREAEQARTDAELKTLRNQLSPHFLLNTLNNIYALIAFDTDKAQLAVLELSKMLRHMLYDNHQKFVPLQNEADFIHNYIELMRLRLPREVKVEVDIRVCPERSTCVAPLLFISLVENAFKHGISPTASSFVSVCLREEEDGVRCLIRNSNFPKNQADKSGSGIGLEQVKRRLQLLYPDNHEWQYGVSKDGNEYVSDLKIFINKE